MVGICHGTKNHLNGEECGLSHEVGPNVKNGAYGAVNTQIQSLKEQHGLSAVSTHPHHHSRLLWASLGTDAASRQNGSSSDTGIRGFMTQNDRSDFY